MTLQYNSYGYLTGEGKFCIDHLDVIVQYETVSFESWDVVCTNQFGGRCSGTIGVCCDSTLRSLWCEDSTKLTSDKDGYNILVVQLEDYFIKK